jgi:protein-tyrosine phosphatase
MNKVIDRLFLGNASSAKYAMNKFDLVVNCSKDIPQSLPDLNHDAPNGLFIRIPVDDNRDQNEVMFNHLQIVTEIIHKVLINNGSVLVHCQQGASRSPTVIVAYLITYSNLTIEQAIKYVQSIRTIAFFCNNIVFQDALTKFQQICHLKI